MNHVFTFSSSTDLCFIVIPLASHVVRTIEQVTRLVTILLDLYLLIWVTDNRVPNTESERLVNVFKGPEKMRTFGTILDVMKNEDLFELQEEILGFTGFKIVSENINIDKKSKDVFKWAADRIKKFRKHGHLYIYHKLTVLVG